jgi:hypothetical protein
MATNVPFRITGKTITLQTSGTISTSQSRQVQASDFGLNDLPMQLRVVNNGTVDVWVSFTAATATAAFPTAGTTTVGTPTVGIRLKPNIIEIISLNTTPVLWINDISGTASQTYDLTPGEGL